MLEWINAVCFSYRVHNVFSQFAKMFFLAGWSDNETNGKARVHAVKYDRYLFLLNKILGSNLGLLLPKE